MIPTVAMNTAVWRRWRSRLGKGFSGHAAYPSFAEWWHIAQQGGLVVRCPIYGRLAHREGRRPDLHSSLLQDAGMNCSVDARHGLRDRSMRLG